MHYLPDLLSYAVGKNEIYRNWFVLMAKMETNEQWYRMHCILHTLVEIAQRIAHTGGNRPELKYYTHGRSNLGETSRVQVLHRSMAIAYRCMSHVQL